MSGLAAGLARGLAMYGQGRMIADQRDFERQQAEAEQQRRRAMDERQAAMMQAQLEQMQFQRTQAEAQAKRQQEADQRDAFEGGYRRTEDAARMGGAMQATGAGLGPMGTAVDALAGYGRQMQQAAKSPAFTVGGTPMAKTAESLVERVQRLQAQQREGERMQDRDAQRERDERLAAQQAERDARLAKNERSLLAMRLSGAGGSGASQPAAPMGPTTDGGRKAAGFLLRMQGASDTFDAIEPQRGDKPAVAEEKLRDTRPGFWQSARGLVPFIGDEWERSTFTPEQGSYDTAKRDFLAAVLRKESGAQINEAEWDEGNRRYFPVRGDTRDIVEQKRRNREQAMQATAIEAGLAPANTVPAQRRQTTGEQAASGLFTPLDQPQRTSVPARRPGETVAEYRARTGGR